MMHRFSTICFLVVVSAISSTLAEDEKIPCRLDSTCPKGYKCNSKWYNIIFSSHCVPKDGENVDTITVAPDEVTSSKSAAPGSAATTAAAPATTAGPAASGVHPAGPAASGAHPALPVVAISATTAAAPAAGGGTTTPPAAASSAISSAASPAPAASGETTAPPAAATTKGDPAIVKI